MRRREFIAGLGSAAALPTLARAQQVGNAVRIGFLPLGLPTNAADRLLVEAFQRGLREVGLVEGRDVVVDLMWVSRETGFPEAVSELVMRGARILVTGGSSASAAAKQYSPTIPNVFVSVGNPIGIKLIESFAHPGGNATGFSDVLADLSSKYVDLATQLGPPKAPLDYLWHTEWPDGQSRFQATERAAEAAGLALRSRGMRDIDEVNDILALMKRAGAVTLIIQPSPFTYRWRDQISDSAISNGLGTIFSWPAAAREGALIAYGPDHAYMYRRAALYVERILKGERPADLPVEQPTRFELVVNLMTAKAVGIIIPPTLLAVADEVIE
jgi:putative tryptophan/tyrosine transport system substrate-binding protein